MIAAAAADAADAMATGIKHKTRQGEKKKKRWTTRSRTTDPPFRVRLPTEQRGSMVTQTTSLPPPPPPPPGKAKEAHLKKNAPVLSVSTVRVQWAALAHGLGEGS